MPLSASCDHLPTGSRQAGLGRTSVTLSDFWSCLNNPAGIAQIEQISVGISYEGRFSLSQLSSKSIGLVVPTRFGVLAATVNHFGTTSFYEMKAGIVYARAFSPHFRIGVQMDYLQTTVGEGYGSKSNITFEVGIQSDITPRLTLGTWIFNPFQVRLAKYNDERYPAIFRLGLLWKISENLLINTEGEKSTYFKPIILRVGIEYNISKKYFFRGGFSSAQEFFTMGIGLTIKKLSLDLSATMHESLGFSPQASMYFKF